MTQWPCEALDEVRCVQQHDVVMIVVIVVFMIVIMLHRSHYHTRHDLQV